MIHNQKIGVALGGGSARGWAHIGVLRELRSMGIQPDVVAGTSIGALVGACYCADKLEPLAEWVEALTWRDMISLLDVKFSGGLIEGRRLFQFFNEHLPDMTIDDLPKPFAAVTTELDTGREVWLQHGLISDAVRASISLPGLFTPYKTKDGHFYLDGGLVNPVPISLCRALGADIVIAVNLNSEIVGKHLRQTRSVSGEFIGPDEAPHTEQKVSAEEESIWNPESDFLKKIAQMFNGNGTDSDRSDALEKPGMMEVMATAINIMQDRITRSRMAGDPADLVLNPRLSHIGLMEFYRSSESIAVGEQTVRYARRELNALLGIDEKESGHV